MPTLILPGNLAANHEYVTKALTGRVYQVFMDSQFGGKLLRGALGTDNWKNNKIVKEEADEYESSVFIGAPSNTFTIGRRRVAVRAKTVGNETQLELEETKSGGMVIGLVIFGLCMCLVPGMWYMFRNYLATRKHKGLLETLKNEVLEKVPGSREAAPAAS
jgi:hypothetical protein